jgi:AGCS family alanine or glycine:cation symporter
MISWSYYGERASEYLFGHKGIKTYRVIFLFFVFISPMVSLHNVIGFTDLLILSMAYPNILGMVILSGKVAEKAKDYRQRLKNGEMTPTQ